MPRPSQQLATLRPDIGESLQEFSLSGDQARFVAGEVLPFADVQLPEGTYPVIEIAELLQNSETLRNNHSGYNMIDWRFRDAPYKCKEHGIASPVDARSAAAYENFFEAELMTAQLVHDRVMRNREKRVANLLFDETAFAAQATPIDNEWDENHTTDATPIDDVKAAAFAIYARCGIWPNALIINQRVFMRLRSLDQVIESIVSQGAGNPAKASDVTAQMLAEVFGLEKVIVAGGTHNLSDEGQAAVVDQIWSDEYAVVTKVAQSQSFAEPCIGRTLHWSKDGSTPGGTVESWWDEDMRRNIIRCRMDCDEKLIHPVCAQLLTNVTTS